MFKDNEKEFFTNFDHPVPCSKVGCERLTNWGHAAYWNDGREIMLSPYCWEHGFALRDFMLTGGELNAEQIKEQYDCVERFVIGYHHGKGTATVKGSCDPKDVLEFTLFELEDNEVSELNESCAMYDFAWNVDYEREGALHHGYALFNSTDCCFEWYRIERVCSK